MAMSSEQMLSKLLADGAKRGSTLFVSYLAGREPTERAIREAARSRAAGEAKRHFVGTLHEVWLAKNGDPILTVVAHNRDSETQTPPEGAYRSFNPRLGTLLSVEVVA